MAGINFIDDYEYSRPLKFKYMTTKDKIKTKKEIIEYFKNQVESISYDIEYHSYKGNTTIKDNLTNKIGLVFDIAASIGISDDTLSEWVYNAKTLFDKDVNDKNITNENG